MPIIIRVIVPNLDPLDYVAPPELNLNIGDLVIVPFRSKTLLGIVWETNITSEFAIEKIRPVLQKLPLTIAPIDLKFIHWIADYYLFNLGTFLNLLINL